MARPKEFSPDEALLKAMQVFWTKGYTATSMEDLVQAMGINRASLYNAFGNKHSLYMKALQTYWEKSLLPPLQAFVGSGNMLAQLAIYNERSGCFLLGCMSELAMSDAEVAAFSESCLTEINAMLVKAVARERENGLWRGLQSDQEAASLLLTCLVGMRLLGRAGMAHRGHAGMALLERIVKI